jgi:hypothetical protein
VLQISQRHGNHFGQRISKSEADLEEGTFFKIVAPPPDSFEALGVYIVKEVSNDLNGIPIYWFDQI